MQDLVQGLMQDLVQGLMQDLVQGLMQDRRAPSLFWVNLPLARIFTHSASC